MAGLDAGRAIPVWLAEDDLGCIICHDLLAWPATLPCGHTFCRDCLLDLWAARRSRFCPSCREGAPGPPQLRKNTMLEDLADKYRLAARELEPLSPGPEPTPAPRPASRPGRPTAQLRVEAPKSSTEVDRELAKLVERLIDIVRKLQSPRHLLESEPDKEVSILAMTLLDGVDLSLASPKVSSSPPEQKMKDILHDLEDIQEKLRENFTQKGALEEQTQVELPEVPSSSSRPLPDQSRFAPKKASSFARWAISPTFDLESLSCNLKVSVDLRTVTVSDFPMLYAWSPERFASSQALCSQALSSGQHYWEVDTQRCSHWAVGVASRGMKRDQILGRTTDSWCVEWKGASQLSAWCMVKETVLGSDRPSVVGIWLDLEEGKLAFYSKADQAKPLFECPISVSVPLHPAFWLYGLDPGNSLTIRKMNV
ncbi:E3 ubiquitin-protein ligase RNF135 isoform X1 [Bos indicus x Bos taurus]|uniref:E3 ubiquitin-protein ligase RNF135 n=1 Tax=Bos indicus x Bos taurus TaxID=30522 RepID=A0A4W2GAI8_BOBOX|nr:E3 ubiquitin-protein ligase RNF135 isoform X1 [Bos indicus x Bos taurus]